MSYTENLRLKKEELKLLEETLNLWAAQWEKSDTLKTLMKKVDKATTTISLRELSGESDY